MANRLAASLRDWLRDAGVKRHELLDEDSETTKPLTFHDLRATGLTWLAIAGVDPLKIMQRAGHSSYETTQRYVRTAEAVRDGFGVPFPTLPASLLTFTGLTGGLSDSQVRVISERETGFEPATSSLGNSPTL